MLFSWLSKFLASLLVAVLSGAIITMVMGQTVLSSHYIEGKLSATNSYVRLSDALDTEISKDTASAPPDMAAKLQTIITPTVLQTKINGALQQLQAYYRGNGQPPTIDLTDLAAQAQAAGVPVSTDSTLNKPIQLGSGDQVRNASKTFDHIRLTTLLASLVLGTALLAVSWKQHRYTVLPGVLISVGVLVGLLALIFALTPGLITHYIKFDTTSNAFASIGSDLATSIAHDLAWRFGMIAGFCISIGIATRVWVVRLQSKISLQTVTPRALPKAPARIIN